VDTSAEIEFMLFSWNLCRLRFELPSAIPANHSFELDVLGAEWTLLKVSWI
jgi:hypothetical protein